MDEDLICSSTDARAGLEVANRGTAGLTAVGLGLVKNTIERHKGAADAHVAIQLPKPAAALAPAAADPH